ncbi:MAG: alpha-amylase [Candidatus Izimaplasma sp.]|nr:alpha-amylase [Candidatus Izimaplasma bacterium]
MSQLYLEKVRDVLKNKKSSMVFNYTVPDLWNCFDYSKEKFIKTPDHELIVNPYDFFQSLIDNYLLPKKKSNIDYLQSYAKLTNRQLKQRNYLPGDWIKNSILYSTMIRTSAAWDHDRSGYLEDNNIYHMCETGSFVKMLALLPLLKKMGIDVVYMLPISLFSLKDKKGDLGSPYGVKSFTKLDPNLKDSLTDQATTVEEEFKAFVEACHILDMKVIIDIIPRTNSVDSDLIRTHPEWFYWIKASDYDNYSTPTIPGIPPTATPTLDMMEKVYAEPDTLRHINMFQYDPKTQDSELWKKVKRKKNLSKAIMEAYDLRVAPAFSDYINDPQPPWTDVTFFRMYEDFPKATRQFLDTTKRPPYILNDTIKSNMYPGETPNIELWKKLADIIPEYQRHYGIDGARIDMGHALPKELLTMIMSKARDIDSDFTFIAEELQPQNADKARENNYNLIISNGFIMEPRFFEGKLLEFMHQSIDLPLPVFAMGDTHDTPRLAAREGGTTTAKLLTILNYFMPEAVPFINSGQEVYETQPMNTGLDARDNEQFMLNQTDPYYGKLALFDKYQFHYTNPHRWELPDILDFIKPIRQKYLPQITNKKYFIPLYGKNHPNTLIGLSYFKKTKKKEHNVLIVLANSHPYEEVKRAIPIHDLRHQSQNNAMVGSLLFSTHEDPRPFTQFFDDNTLDIHLGRGEIKIIEL